MKTQLTKEDPSGWYLCEWQDKDLTRWWTGTDLKTDPTATGIRQDPYTNFRRLVEEGEPEVIEGNGQRVTEEGWYWHEWKRGLAESHAIYKAAGDRFESGYRYIKAVPPTFPPRKPFVAPPKPVLVLVRMPDGDVTWVKDDLLKFAVNMEPIDPQTGEPIATKVQP